MDPDRICKPIGFTALKAWLRHRHPMILLDRILDHEPGHFLTALMSISGSLDCIAGHFPERAIYPGSQLFQAFAQAGIILYQMSTSRLKEDEMTVIGSVQARFYKVIVPGDRVILHVTCERLSGTTFHFAARVTVDDRRVAAFRGTLARIQVDQAGTVLW